MSGWEGCALGAAGTWSDSQAQPAGTTDQEAAKGFLAAQEKFQKGLELSSPWSTSLCDMVIHGLQVSLYLPEFASPKNHLFHYLPNSFLASL